jgi:ABC-type branched-subunit amino acid transport system ATPase component
MGGARHQSDARARCAPRPAARTRRGVARTFQINQLFRGLLVVEDLYWRRTRSRPCAGEPSTAVIPSAISNAVFDATGVRLCSVPYTPAKVKAALWGV